MFKLSNKKRQVVFSLLTLNIFHTFFSVSFIEFEQVNVGWVFFRIIKERCLAALMVKALTTYNFSVNIYLLKINNKNTKKRCEIWSKLTILT